MAQELDVQSTPNVTAAVNVPDVVHNLDTNTGPQAQPQAFGPNMGGLVQGLSEATDSLHMAGRSVAQFKERDQAKAQAQQAAQDQMTSLSATVGLQEKYTQLMSDRKDSGNPMNPDEFNSVYGPDVDKIANAMPTPGAALDFKRRSAEMGAEFADQSIRALAEHNQQKRVFQMKDTINSLVQASANGTLPADQAANGIASVSGIAAIATGNSPAVQPIAQQATAQVWTNGVSSLAQTQGAGAASLAVRGGYGGSYIPDPQRETLASTLDNTQTIMQDTRASVAQQRVNDLAAKAQAGQTVSPQDQMDAAKELALAKNAQPIQTNPPDFVDYVQGRVDHYSKLQSQLGDSPVAAAQAAAYKTIEQHELLQTVTQRMSTVSPDQGKLLVDRMEARFGTDGPDGAFVRQARVINAEMTSRIAAGDSAGVAMQNPVVLSSMQKAIQAQAQASSGGDKGAADAALNTAIQTSFSAQRMLGVEPGHEKVLTKAQADQYASSLNSAQDYKNMFGHISSTFGGMTTPDGRDIQSSVIKEVFDKKGTVPGVVQLAALAPNRQDNWDAVAYQNPLKAEEMKPIQAAVMADPNFKKFALSQQSDGRWAGQSNEWASGIAQMASYQMAQRGVTDPAQAVATAIQNTISSHYTVVNTDAPRTGQSLLNWRGNVSATLALPKVIGKTEIAATPDDAMALQDKANVALASLPRDYKMDIGQSDATPGDSALRWHQAMAQGKWVYDAGSQSLVRYQTGGPNGDAPFLLNDGRPLAFSLTGLKATNVIPNSVHIPLEDQHLDPQATAEEVHHALAKTIDVGTKLDVDLNTLMPSTPPSSMPYFPLKTGAAPAPQPSSPDPMATQPGAQDNIPTAPVARPEDYYGGADKIPVARVANPKDLEGPDASVPTAPVAMARDYNSTPTRYDESPYIKSEGARIDARLEGGLKGLGSVFAKAGTMYDIDPNLLASVSMHETGRGTSRALLSGNNAMGISPNNGGPARFQKAEDSIFLMAKKLAHMSDYAQFRKTGSIKDLADGYAPVGAPNDPKGQNGDWFKGVSKFYAMIAQ